LRPCARCHRGRRCQDGEQRGEEGGGRRHRVYSARAWAAWFVLPSLATSAEPVRNRARLQEKKRSLHMLCFHQKFVMSVFWRKEPKILQRFT
jgi:hypothetical protein